MTQDMRTNEEKARELRGHILHKQWASCGESDIMSYLETRLIKDYGVCPTLAESIMEDLKEDMKQQVYWVYQKHAIIEAGGTVYFDEEEHLKEFSLAKLIPTSNELEALVTPIEGSDIFGSEAALAETLRCESFNELKDKADAFISACHRLSIYGVDMIAALERLGTC